VRQTTRLRGSGGTLRTPDILYLARRFFLYQEYGLKSNQNKCK
jgi:hypothetical protein